MLIALLQLLMVVVYLAGQTMASVEYFVSGSGQNVISRPTIRRVSSKIASHIKYMGDQQIQWGTPGV